VTILWPAKNVDAYGEKTERKYQLGPCQVFLTGTDTVTSIKLDQLSPDCSFNLQTLAPAFSSNPNPINAYCIAFAEL
jgi:hypothetical protein